MYNPCRVKSIRIAAYSVMYIFYTSVTSFRVVNPAFYLPLVRFFLWSQMRCREREFPHRNRVEIVVVEDRRPGVRGCRSCPR